MEWKCVHRRKWYGYIDGRLAYEVFFNGKNGWTYVDLSDDCGIEDYDSAKEAREAAEREARHYHHWI